MCKCVGAERERLSWLNGKWTTQEGDASLSKTAQLAMHSLTHSVSQSVSQSVGHSVGPYGGSVRTDDYSALEEGTSAVLYDRRAGTRSKDELTDRSRVRLRKRTRSRFVVLNPPPWQLCMFEKLCMKLLLACSWSFCE